MFAIWMMTSSTQAQVIISQYYEGGGTNKWIELTNLGNTAVNTASPQLKLGLWAQTGSTGNINITGLPSQTVDLNFTIPAHGSVLVGNPANGTEVPYLNSSSALQNSSLVINFNGNDGIALLDNNSNIIDQFGQGINAADKSYYRNLSVTSPSASFVLQEWTNVTLATVQAASIPDVARLNYHLQNNCTAPATGASSMVYYTIKPNSIGGAFTAGIADEYLVLISTSPTLSALPQNNIVYQAGNIIGNATVINRSSTNVFYASGLTPSTSYYFFVFALNSNCTGGPVYAADYLSATRATSAVPAPQPYSIYFGNLHAHSSFSDGNADDPLKTPADDYAFARESMCMDFLGISEHNHTGAGMKLANWQPGKDQAIASTSANFVALYGMEWGVIDDGGHAVVYGMDSLLGWEDGQYQVLVPKGNFSGAGGLFEKVNQKGGNAFTYLAHPVITDYNNIFSNTYSLDADNAIVGTALESGPAFSTSISYNNAGVPMGFLDFYKILLSKGYHVGPLIDHDNHNLTFGRTARTRLAVIAPDLTEQSLLSAVKQMRFYATEDCSAKVRFTVAGEQMGAIMIRPGTPQLNVQYETSSPVSSVKVMYGEPGSGSFPVQLTTLAPGVSTYTDATLPNFGQRYYYFDITETDGTRIITSPIWYTRIDGALASYGFNAFTAVNRPGDVLLKWGFTTEENNTAFRIERSIDGGRSFELIGTQPGRGFSISGNEYTFMDAAPFTGTAYYRIASVAPGGAMQYSPQRLIKRGGAMQNIVSVYPNPVNDIANIQVNAIANGSASVILFDMGGRKLSTMNFTVKKGEQVLSLPVFALVKGQYAIRLVLNGEQFTRLMNKQ
ncbi:lamin tail domain-containing protein [Ferruginibacter sp. HRS2-29]|uniref:lamin tail domain-containing protein n=1 Tax=Ferruginibacter sp. HRS2-29 TaxID=2487334 RepID=UPI0020CC39D8|nr:lamin tail domain-containing protein [Ferruginibacter sp. HRS2-29]